MTIKDKLEIGLKEDAPFRRDNLPEGEVRGPQQPAGPDRSPVIPAARVEAARKAKRGPTQDDDVEPEKVVDNESD